MLIPTSLCNTKITRFGFTPILRNSFSHSHAGTRSFQIHASPSEVDAQAQTVEPEPNEASKASTASAALDKDLKKVALCFVLYWVNLQLLFLKIPI
jgi:hypothetical protein